MTLLELQAQLKNLIGRVAELERQAKDHDERLCSHDKKAATDKKTLGLNKP